MLKFIHDLDNMLYREPPQMMAAMMDAAVDAAIQDCRLNVSVQEARDMILRSVIQGPTWTSLLEQKGMDFDAFIGPYHKRLDHRVIQPYASLASQFNKLAGHADHVVLTHSNSDWAMRTIKHIDLDAHLPEERVLSWEKYKAWKSESVAGFEKAAALLQAEPKDIIFSDDSLRNLKIPKAMGMTTVWVSHGRALPAEAASFVDDCIEDVTVLMQRHIHSLKL